MNPLGLALLIVASQVYTWTDKDGVEHFTDNLASIPKGVKVRTTEGAELGTVTTEKVKPVVAEVAPVVQPVVVVVAAPPQGQRAPSPAEEEDRWRRLFREARAKVSDLEAQIETDRKSTEEVNGMPINARFTCPQYGAPLYVPAPGGFVTSSTGITVGGTGQLGGGATVTGTVSSTGTTVYRPFPTYVTPCGFGFNPEYDRIRERLEKNRREVVRAKEELADLERRASFEAVPLHWRR